jgi:hypothetical protein
MQKRLLLWVVPLSIVSIIVLLGIEESRTLIIALFLRIILFVKKNFIALLAAFFLVKGKFILKLFLKKLAILSATGLGKRYVVEKVIMGSVKTHFLDHISGDIKRLVRHAKKNFQNFTLVKKMLTIFAFLGSLGFIAKSMGVMLAVKVFLAKVWSFLLALFLKVGTAVTYFFTDYLWGSWIAPIVEVILFSWLLSWMEKVPFLARGLRRVYRFFIFLFGWLEYAIEKVFHIPVKGFLRWLVRKIQAQIDHLVGNEHLSIWRRVKQKRVQYPNRYTQCLTQRQKRVQKKREKSYLSTRDVILQGRKTKHG